ncbi:MAG: hypothetical protein WC860_07665 [Candidatus Margulisiibacteriota bacterium]|jgi:hypothetical protein
MVKQVTFLLLIIFFANCSFAAAKELKISNYFFYESYIKPNNDLDGALGFQANLFLNKNVSFGILITGAAIGTRGGYGTASLGLGYQIPLIERFTNQTNIFIGAGGGKDVTAGGGLVLNLETGLNYKLSNSLDLGARIGWLKFFNGLDLTFVNFGLIYNFIEVF